MMASFVDKKPERLGLLRIPIHTFRMEVTPSFYKASKAPRRTGWIFTNPQFDFSASTPLDQKPRKKKPFRKPKWTG
jgi:hypothetical protein